jgi:hypothetical protein
MLKPGTPRNPAKVNVNNRRKIEKFCPQNDVISAVGRELKFPPVGNWVGLSWARGDAPGSVHGRLPRVLAYCTRSVRAA